MRYIKSTIIILLLIVVSCGKEEEGLDPTAFDYFIFGDYYGFCAGDCTTAFKIEDGAIYPDKENFFPIDPEESFIDTPLSDEAHELALDLVLDFPEDLWNDDTEVFGIPDAYDQGGIFVSYKRNGIVKSWTIDTQIHQIEDAPDYVKSYTTEIKKILADLK